MKNKQEVIEILKSLRNRLNYCGCQECHEKDEQDLEAAHNRIAPLIRGEFPEESIQTLLSQLYTITDCVARRGDTLENDPTIETREEIKRLWEGRGLRVVDNTYELGSHPCPRCGFPLNAWDKVCLACDGTGECQHKGKIVWATFEGKRVGRPICYDCDKEIDRRSGGERRHLRTPRRRGVSLGSGRRRTDCSMQDDRRTQTRRKAA